MKKVILLSAVCLLMLTTAVTHAQILVNTQTVQGLLGRKDLILLQLGREESYKNEHISGAQFISSEEFTVDKTPMSYDLPTVKDLQETLEAKGISNNSRIIIYTETNWIESTTRLFLTFDYLGLRDRVSILEGGLTSWKSSGGKVTSEIPIVTKGSLNVNPRKDLIVELSEVKKAVEGKHAKIVDCRAAVYYQGIDMIEMHGGRKGRIPGAVSIPYSSLFEKSEDGSMKYTSLDAIQKIFDDQGLKKDDEIIVYCHIGMQMTAVYTAAQLLGYKNVKAFDGSFHEWGADKSLPVEL